MGGTIRVRAGVVRDRLAARPVAADAKPPLAGCAVNEPGQPHLRGELSVVREVRSSHGVGSLEELLGDDRLQNANWEGVAWYEDGNRLVLVYDKTPGINTQAALVVDLPKSWL